MIMIHSHPHNQRLRLKLSSMSMCKLPEYNVLSKKCKIQSYIHKFSFKDIMERLEGITSVKKEGQTKESIDVLRKAVLSMANNYTRSTYGGISDNPNNPLEIFF